MLLDYTYNESIEDLQKIYDSGNAVSLLTCSKIKGFVNATQYLPAGEAYVCESFQKSMTLANYFGAPVYIFSAKHGIMSTDKLIQDYNVTYRNLDPQGQIESAILRRQLQTLQGKWIVLYGTKSYAEKLLKLVPDARIVCPFYGLRNGERKRKNIMYLKKIGAIK